MDHKKGPAKGPSAHQIGKHIVFPDTKSIEDHENTYFGNETYIYFKILVLQKSKVS